MSDLDPAEMSALLDGELDPGRAHEVEAIIAADPALAAQFEQLKRADQRLRALAAAAAFHPEISLPPVQAQTGVGWLAPCLAVVLLAWALGKLTPAAALAFGANAVSLGVLVVCLMRLVEREAHTGQFAA